jgi:Bacterial SH3 domain
MGSGTKRLLQTFRIHCVCILPVSIILVLFAPQTLILACGSIDDWIAVYERGEKHKALFHMLDCADNYSAPADDIALLPIIKDALGSTPKVAAAAIQVFMNFNHLWGARNEPDYVDVFKAITGRDDWNSLAEFHDWMVVTANSGANMREEASLDSAVITTVKYGMQAKAVSKQGEWIKVRPVGPGSSDPRFERKVGYIHESLLMPY